MHEVGLMQEVVTLAVAEAGRAGASRIHRVRLRVGRLAGVEPDALDLAFEVATSGTPAQGAVLEVQTIGVRCGCADCGSVFEAEGDIFRCPGCGAISRDVRCGRELELATLEVS